MGGVLVLGGARPPPPWPGLVLVTSPPFRRTPLSFVGVLRDAGHQEEVTCMCV